MLKKEDRRDSHSVSKDIADAYLGTQLRHMDRKSKKNQNKLL